MSITLASASQADGATTTSAAFAFSGQTITATCTNGATPPNQAAQVQLQLSADNITWSLVDSKWFGMAPSGYYSVKFNLADYADLPDQFGLTAPWLYYRLKFLGNVGAAITIAAADTGSKQMAVIPLTATTATGGGAVVAWTPPEDGPIFITRAILATTTKSTGAATLNVGVAANATTSASNLMTAADVGTATIAYDNIVNASTSGKAFLLLPAGSYVTATGSASTAGLVGNLYVEYVKP